MKQLVKCIAVCILFIAQIVAATEISDVFVTEVIANSQSRGDRNAALREALIVVLNRITATQGIMLDIKIRNALNNAASYVDEYQYAALDEQGNASPARRISVTFNEVAIMQLMHGNGFATWGKDREAVLLWLVLEQGRKKHIFSSVNDSEVNKAIQLAAKQQGIPILLPFMDLDDQLLVSAKDISRLDFANIQIASSRYAVDAVVTGRLIKRKSCWRTEWSLKLNDKLEKWTVPCEGLQANLSTAFQGIYERLSAFYVQK